MSDPVSARYFFYLEGELTPFKQAVVMSQLNGVASAAVTIAYDQKHGLVRQIRAKTLGHLFFLDAGGDMRLIFEGELMGKAYAMTPTGPQASMNFAGIGANYQNASIALLPAAEGAPLSTGGIMNQSGIWLNSGATLSVQGVPSSPSVPTAYLTSPILKNAVVGPFKNSKQPSGGFDYPAAFQGFLQQYITGPTEGADSGQGLVSGSTASQYLRIAEFRFSLVEGITGATSAELSDLFYGTGADGVAPTEVFLGAVLQRVAAATISDVLSVMREISTFSFHGLSELICPPFVGPRGAQSSAADLQKSVDAFNALAPASTTTAAPSSTPFTAPTSFSPLVQTGSFGRAAGTPATAPGAGTGTFTAPTSFGPIAGASSKAQGTDAKGGRKILGRLFVFPMLFNADPPVCNLFLPHMVNSVSYGVQCVKPTRLITSQSTFTQDYATPTFIATILPATLEEAVVKKGKTPATVDLSGAITKEEAEVGIHMTHDSDIYPGVYDVPIEKMQAWMQKTADLRFYAARAAQQATQIMMDFNPYPVVGLPGAFVDSILGQGRGLVDSVQHTLTPEAGATAVSMACCYFDGDAVENTNAAASVEDGYGGNLKLFANGGPSAIYEKVLGIESLTKAAQHIVGDAPPAAAGASAASAPSTADAATTAASQFVSLPGTPTAASAASSASMSLKEALDLVVSLTASTDNESAHAAEIDFVSRPIASYAELVEYYGGKDQVANQAESDAADKAIKGTVTKGVPAVLGFQKPFIDAGNTRLVSTAKDGATEKQPLVSNGSGGLFKDRRGPVTRFLTELENA